MSKVELIEEYPIEGKRLGRHIEHDDRSRDYAWGIVLSPSRLKAVHHRRYGQIFDQGSVGSCTGNAVAGSVNTQGLHVTRHKVLTEVEAVAIYSLATKIDEFAGEYPPEDTGSSGLAAAKAAQQMELLTGYRHAFSLEEALSALQVSSIICGVNWYEGFDTPDHTGMVEIAGQVRGGHEFEILGYEPESSFDEGIIIAANSWNRFWGVVGRFRFKVKTLRQLLAEDGDVTILS